MQMEVIWDMTPCQLSHGCERFGGSSYSPVQGPEISSNSTASLKMEVWSSLFTFVKFRRFFTELSCSVFSLYLEGIQFESRPRRRLTWGFDCYVLVSPDTCRFWFIGLSHDNFVSCASACITVTLLFDAM